MFKQGVNQGDLGTTDVNLEYLKQSNLKVALLGRGYAWLDTGTPDSLMDASNYIATIERRQGLKIGCIEEVAYRMGYIKQDQLKKIINQSLENDYQRYLKVILNEKIK